LVGIASEVRGWWLRIGKNKILVASSKLQVVSKGRSQRFEDRCRKIKSDRSAVEWLPFSEKNGCKFQDASCEKKKENLFLKGY
jgi:hypothetical protein